MEDSHFIGNEFVNCEQCLPASPFLFYEIGVLKHMFSRRFVIRKIPPCVCPHFCRKPSRDLVVSHIPNEQVFRIISTFLLISLVISRLCTEISRLEHHKLCFYDLPHLAIIRKQALSEIESFCSGDCVQMMGYKQSRVIIALLLFSVLLAICTALPIGQDLTNGKLSGFSLIHP